MKTDSVIRRSIPLAVMSGLLVLGAGCKNPFVHEDQPAPAAQQAARADACRTAGTSSRARRPADSQRHSSQDQCGVRTERPEHPGEHGQRSGYPDGQGGQRRLPRAGGCRQRFDRRGEDGGQQPGGRAAADSEGAATDAEAQGSGRGCSATTTASSGRGACSAAASAIRTSTAAAAASAWEDGDAPCRCCDSDSHDRYAG